MSSLPPGPMSDLAGLHTPVGMTSDNRVEALSQGPSQSLNPPLSSDMRCAPVPDLPRYYCPFISTTTYVTLFDLDTIENSSKTASQILIETQPYPPLSSARE